MLLLKRDTVIPFWMNDVHSVEFHRVPLSSVKKQYGKENKKRNKGCTASHHDDAASKEWSSCFSQTKSQRKGTKSQKSSTEKNPQSQKEGPQVVSL